MSKTARMRRGGGGGEYLTNSVHARLGRIFDINDIMYPEQCALCAGAMIQISIVGGENKLMIVGGVTLTYRGVHTAP